LRGQDDAVQRRVITSAWRELGGWERFVWNKLITGGFRIGVSDGLVVRALAAALKQEPDVIAQRLAGSWEPTADAYTRLGLADTADVDVSRPYPFYLASPLESEPETLGDPGEWLAEWKWDGIRAQLIRRAGRTFIWSRGGDLITERFPELVEAAALLPDGTVLDGELIGWTDGRPLDFSALQRRIGRKRVGAKLLRDVPAALIVYDLLEHDGADVRERPLQGRREMAARLLRAGPTAFDRFPLSPAIAFDEWSELGRLRDGAREQPAEGVMLKRLDSPYQVGRRRGAWWKWKSNAITVDAVLIYAQPGHGRRAGLHTDYTFAVWDGGALVPFAKAYTGLNDAEIRRLDAWIRRSTVEKFGPVRSVKPEHVFELAFENVQRSSRHKSGIAVRFPRIVRWRTDKRAEDADSLSALHALLGDP
jgi:DNA ligase 1